MVQKEYTITVSGVGPFPLDMLRYDGCFPDTSVDVEKIRGSFNILGPNKWSIRVVKISQQKWEPTTKRWESFGWKVININLKK